MAIPDKLCSLIIELKNESLLVRGCSASHSCRFFRRFRTETGLEKYGNLLENLPCRFKIQILHIRSQKESATKSPSQPTSQPEGQKRPQPPKDLATKSIRHKKNLKTPKFPATKKYKMPKVQATKILSQKKVSDTKIPDAKSLRHRNFRTSKVPAPESSGPRKSRPPKGPPT